LSARNELSSAELFDSDDSEAGESFEFGPRRAVRHDLPVVLHESRFVGLQRHSPLGPAADTGREGSKFSGENLNIGVHVWKKCV